MIISFVDIYYDYANTLHLLSCSEIRNMGHSMIYVTLI